MNLKRKEPKQLGINTKAFKKDEIKSEADNKKQLVKELHSCMKCKYFWGNDNRCINNKKCGSKNSTNCNLYFAKNQFFFIFVPSYRTIAWKHSLEHINIW